MIAQPGGKTIRANAQNLPDLQPTKDHVKIAGAVHIAVAPSHFLDLAEPPEEQEQVANADTLVLEMPLCGAVLPKRGPPAASPIACGGIKIRIEMGRPCAVDPRARQIGYELAHVQTLMA